LHPVRGWQWSININCEIQRIKSERRGLFACGIDLGWRAREGYVRVGMLCDNQNNIAELRFPLDAPTSRTRRHSLPSGYQDLAQIDRRISELLEQVKSRLKAEPATNLSPVVQALVACISKSRQSGLVRLLLELEKAAIWPKAQAMLHTWLYENDRLRSLRASLQDRLVGRRQWLYRNIASFLARSYQTIALEGELWIKEMIEDKQTKDLAFRKSLRNHQWAAVAELRENILEAANKYGSRVVEAEIRWSTSTCHICGAQVIHTPALELTCSRGHLWDQDVNAAYNILRAVAEEDHLWGPSRPRAFFEIPAVLTGILVPNIAV
jgi:Putative transposase DNA-binding domain